MPKLFPGWFVNESVVNSTDTTKDAARSKSLKYVEYVMWWKREAPKSAWLLRAALNLGKQRLDIGNDAFSVSTAELTKVLGSPEVYVNEVTAWQ